MVTTRSHSTVPDADTHPLSNGQKKGPSVSIDAPAKQASSTPRRPPNKRALSSNHIGAPPDLFPRLSAHASRIHKAKSHILLFFLLCILSTGIYFLNPSLLGFVVKSLAASSWTTVGTVAVGVLGIGMGMVCWTNVYKVDWYEVVAGYWWLVIPALGAVGWAIAIVQEGEKE
ncbi:uncharacterized protein LY89DRAFT_11190 [Mollisia scopiformis]|uniref:Uncharacterized protein n=1 Tax=Mollisia scopiformis TaxID=149040 RepID=A0A194XUR7_MOLSC|nr:uncharacterized protein LY89DRAFT_11190 [Mollisia scopiformis]KUJ24065.1 hypothetical protein LY89DRAFT_11190 [Mollisia scopiformis]